MIGAHELLIISCYNCILINQPYISLSLINPLFIAKFEKVDFNRGEDKGNPFKEKLQPKSSKADS